MEGKELNYSILQVNKILTQKNISIPAMAKNIGMSKQNLYQLLKGNDIHVNTLKKIAAFLDVPIHDFFESEQKEHRQSDKTKVVLQIELDENKNLKMSLGKDLIGLIT